MLKTSKTQRAGPLVTLVATLVLGVLTGTGVAVAQGAEARDVGEPGVAARSWALVDLESGEYLAGADSPEKLPIASTTKIMEAIVVLEKADLDVERDVDLVEDLPDFARAGTRPGRVVVRVDGRRVGETPLVAQEGYEEASFGQRVWYTVEGILE